MNTLFHILLVVTTFLMATLLLIIEVGQREKGTLFHKWFKKYFHSLAVLAIVSIVACFICGITSQSSSPKLTAQKFVSPK